MPQASKRASSASKRWANSREEGRDPTRVSIGEDDDEVMNETRKRALDEMEPSTSNKVMKLSMPR